MSLFARKKQDQKEAAPAKSIFFSNERIDREGNPWKRRAFWFRQEHLGKLKVLAHFQNKKTQVLVDQALREFIEKHWDKTDAVQQMVKKSTGQVKIPIS